MYVRIRYAPRICLFRGQSDGFTLTRPAHHSPDWVSPTREDAKQIAIAMLLRMKLKNGHWYERL